MRLPECTSKNLKCCKSDANQSPEYKNTYLYEPRREMCSVWLGADAAMGKTGWRKARKAVAAFKIKLRRGANVHATHAQPSTLALFHAIECPGKVLLWGDSRPNTLAFIRASWVAESLSRLPPCRRTNPPSCYKFWFGHHVSPTLPCRAHRAQRCFLTITLLSTMSTTCTLFSIPCCFFARCNALSSFSRLGAG